MVFSIDDAPSDKPPLHDPDDISSRRDGPRPASEPQQGQGPEAPRPGIEPDRATTIQEPMKGGVRSPPPPHGPPGLRLEIDLRQSAEHQDGLVEVYDRPTPPNGQEAVAEKEPLMELPPSPPGGGGTNYGENKDELQPGEYSAPDETDTGEALLNPESDSDSSDSCQPDPEGPAVLLCCQPDFVCEAGHPCERTCKSKSAENRKKCNWQEECYSDRVDDGECKYCRHPEEMSVDYGSAYAPKHGHHRHGSLERGDHRKKHNSRFMSFHETSDEPGSYEPHRSHSGDDSFRGRKESKGQKHQSGQHEGTHHADRIKFKNKHGKQHGPTYADECNPCHEERDAQRHRRPSPHHGRFEEKHRAHHPSCCEMFGGMHPRPHGRRSSRSLSPLPCQSCEPVRGGRHHDKSPSRRCGGSPRPSRRGSFRDGPHCERGVSPTGAPHYDDHHYGHPPKRREPHGHGGPHHDDFNCDPPPHQHKRHGERHSLHLDSKHGGRDRGSPHRSSPHGHGPPPPPPRQDEPHSPHGHGPHGGPHDGPLAHHGTPRHGPPHQPRGPPGSPLHGPPSPHRADGNRNHGPPFPHHGGHGSPHRGPPPQRRGSHGGPHHGRPSSPHGDRAAPHHGAHHSPPPHGAHHSHHHGPPAPPHGAHRSPHHGPPAPPHGDHHPHHRGPPAPPHRAHRSPHHSPPPHGAHISHHHGPPAPPHGAHRSPNHSPPPHGDHHSHHHGPPAPPHGDHHHHPHNRGPPAPPHGAHHSHHHGPPAPSHGAHHSHHHGPPAPPHGAHRSPHHSPPPHGAHHSHHHGPPAPPHGGQRPPHHGPPPRPRGAHISPHHGHPPSSHEAHGPPHHGPPHHCPPHHGPPHRGPSPAPEGPRGAPHCPARAPPHRPCGEEGRCPNFTSHGPDHLRWWCGPHQDRCRAEPHFERHCNRPPRGGSHNIHGHPSCQTPTPFDYPLGPEPHHFARRPASHHGPQPHSEFGWGTHGNHRDEQKHHLEAYRGDHQYAPPPFGAQYLPRRPHHWVSDYEQPWEDAPGYNPMPWGPHYGTRRGPNTGFEQHPSCEPSSWRPVHQHQIHPPHGGPQWGPAAGCGPYATCCDDDQEGPHCRRGPRSRHAGVHRFPFW